MKEMIKKYKGTLICSVLVMLAGILVPDGILVCVVQNLLRGLAHQPVPVLGLFGGQFFIELRVHFLLLHVQTLLPKLVSAWYNEKKCRG